MKKILTALLFLTTLFSACNNKKQASPFTNQPNIAEVFSDDTEMNAAILQARLTFNIFDTAYKNSNYNKEDFCAKVRFKTENGGEHIWANNITFENDHYFGVLDEDAVAVAGIKAGDKVKITLENLSDWLFNDNGIMKGGYTIKVLRNKMSKEEKAHFDSTYYLKIVE